MRFLAGHAGRHQNKAVTTAMKTIKLKELKSIRPGVLLLLKCNGGGVAPPPRQNAIMEEIVAGVHDHAGKRPAPADASIRTCRGIPPTRALRSNHFQDWQRKRPPGGGR